MRTFALRLSIVALLAVAAGCSLLLTPEQCASDGDCADKGPEFAGTVCMSGRCDLASAGRASDDKCQSTGECIAAEGPLSVCLGATGRHCAQLTSEDCPTVIGADARDNPLVMGLMVDTSQPVSDDLLLGARLAANDFRQALAGVPGAPGSPPRPLVLVVCAEQSDPVRAAQHLVDTLEVPAIIGPTDSTRLLEVAERVALPRDVLLVSPTASSTLLTDLQDEGLVFRTAPSDAHEGKAMGLFANALQGGATRVVALVTDDDRGRGLSQGLESSLSWSGKSVAQNREDGSYLTLPLPALPSEDDRTRLVAEIIAQSPGLVLLLGGAEQASMIQAIEAAWPASAPRPTYVLAASVASGEFLQQVALSSAPELLGRIRVAYPDNARSPVFQRFRRLAASTSEGMVRPYEAAKTYDAVYSAALAAIRASGQRPGRALSGRDMAAAFAFLERGDPVELSVVQLPDIAARLSVQSIVDLSGASGPLDFDRQGDVETNVELGCLSRQPDGNVSVGAAQGFYRAGTTALAGGLVGEVGSCI